MFFEFGLFGKNVWNGLQHAQTPYVVLLIAAGVIIFGLLIAKQWIPGLAAIGVMLVCTGIFNCICAVGGVLICYVIYKVFLNDNVDPVKQQRRAAESIREVELTRAYSIWSQLHDGYLNTMTYYQLDKEYNKVSDAPSDADPRDVRMFNSKWESYLRNPEPYSERSLGQK